MLLLQALQLVSTCVVDVQLSVLCSNLLHLWQRSAEARRPSEQLEALCRVCLNLLLSVALNVEMWLALMSGAPRHWLRALALSAVVISLPLIRGLLERRATPGADGTNERTTERAAERATKRATASTGATLHRLVSCCVGSTCSAGTLPTTPRRHVSWGSLAFWGSLVAAQCALVYVFIAQVYLI